jgi:uncharacterized membrane protein
MLEWYQWLGFTGMFLIFACIFESVNDQVTFSGKLDTITRILVNMFLTCSVISLIMLCLTLICVTNN